MKQLLVLVTLTLVAAQPHAQSDPKSTALSWLDSNASTLSKVNRNIWGWAETGLEEVKSSAELQNLLKAKWAEKARPGYWPQDAGAELAADETLADWLGRWRRKDKEQDEQIVRATLGQLLFSGDDQKKSLKVISGGEAQRMMIGRLVLGMPNVMLLDEPTNHLDMEAIESLNSALDKYSGTLVFVSHDREFVSSLATRVIELKPDGSHVDFRGSYEDYLASESPVLAAA